MSETTSIEWCDATLAARLTNRVTIVDECWEWQGAKLIGGYGACRYQGRQTTAHRVSYIAFYGSLDDGLVIDHLCRNRACINPLHLEAVTAAENVRRGLRGRLVTHCANGHQFDTQSTGITKQGRRFCLICRRAREARRPRGADYWRAYRAKRKEVTNG